MTTRVALNVAWVLVAATLVFFMQVGFTALESGLVRSKNSINVAIKNFANFLITAALFWLFGFGLMFGLDQGGLIGGSGFAFNGHGAFLTAFFLFQLGFIATATTLMSGAVAERMRFRGYLVLAVFVSAVTYPVFGHWAWGAPALDGAAGGGEGWLKSTGFIDFAGSTVVHSVGGWVALAAIIILGPRSGRFGPGAAPIRGHDLPLTTLGVFVLWIGWYGFNGGSTLALTADVPSIILNTSLAAAFGGLVALALTWVMDTRPDVVTTMNGALAGLVGITASANIQTPARAALIGGVAAIVMQAVTVLLNKLEIDDAVGAVPVHLGAGVWGTLAVALLGNTHAFPSTSSRLHQLAIQSVGIVTCCLWAFGVGFVVLWLVDRVFPFRINRAGELAGLNIAEHEATTELADLLADMDEHRRSGGFERPVRVEPHTEVGQIAAEYNRVLAAIGRKTESLQILRNTAAAANESASVEAALSTVLADVCGFTEWPVGHALLAAPDDPDVLFSTGIWHLARPVSWFDPFREASELEPVQRGNGLAGVALELGQPVFAGNDALIGDPPASVALRAVSVTGEQGAQTVPRVVPLTGLRGIRAPEWVALGLRSGLAVPITAGSSIVGVLEFFSDEPMAAGAEVLQLLLSVGTQLGRVVERQRSEEARLRALIDNMPAQVYLRDLDGRFILVNRRYEEFYGLRQEEIRGKQLEETDRLAEVSVLPGVNGEVDRAVVAQAALHQREVRMIREGREHVMSDTRFPVFDGAGEMVAVAGIDIDVTDQKRREAELAELLRGVETARDAAMEATRGKSRFLANMSHELRTPLNAVIGFTRLVSRNSEALPAKQTDNLGKILISAEHLLALIDEILDLSRIEAGEVRLEPVTVDVREVLREVAESLEPLIQGPRVQLRVDVDGEPAAIITDRGKLRQIVLNLVSNAVKYTDDGIIELTATTNGGLLRIDVADSGIGIPASQLISIFDEFHRVEAPSARRAGTGLGLTIARRLARALGGDVTVRSVVGLGSTFTLQLPLDGAAHGDVQADRRDVA
jgi:ammonium transporter